VIRGVHVALLRGINVGRAKRVAMADLRALVESLGYGDVRTLLNSGNVVFTAAAKTPGNAGARIEKAMVAKLGVSSRIIVLSAAEVDGIMNENPLVKVAKDPTRLMVSILADPADRSKLAPMLKQPWGREAMGLGKRAAYVWCPNGLLESRLQEAVARALGDAVTTRNWATMTKLHALMKDAT
jgi:uncharacterized protein (DUF1697 family)